MKQDTTTQTGIQIKTIDINAKEWFDKVNGNSYHSVRTTINYGMPDEKTIYAPIQYGYGEQYEYTAFNSIVEAGYVPKHKILSITIPWRYYENNGIIERKNIQRNCLKRDVVAWGKE